MRHLPNILTLLRLLLVPVYFLVFFSEVQYNMFWAFGVFLLAGLTDILDGYLARKYQWTTNLGMIMDPLADKLMTLSVILSLVISGVIEWWLAIFVFLRDLGMIIGGAFLAAKQVEPIPADRWGKATTVLFYIAILLLVFDIPYSVHFLGFVIMFSFLTSWNYLQKSRQQRMAS